MPKRQTKKTTSLNTQLSAMYNAQQMGRIFKDMGGVLNVFNRAYFQQIQEANEVLRTVAESFRLKFIQDDTYGQLHKAISAIASQWQLIDFSTIGNLSPLQQQEIYPSLLELSENLVDTEDAIEVITPEVIEESLPEFERGEIDKVLKEQARAMEEIKSLRFEIETIKATINIPALQANNKGDKTKLNPNTETRSKIRKLADNRESEIRDRRQIVGWIKSCHGVPIDPETARINAPNLRQNWGNKEYRWSEEQENWEA